MQSVQKGPRFTFKLEIHDDYVKCQNLIFAFQRGFVRKIPNQKLFCTQKRISDSHLLQENRSFLAQDGMGTDLCDSFYLISSSVNHINLVLGCNCLMEKYNKKIDQFLHVTRAWV